MTMKHWLGKTAALVIAHPGHELRIYRWLELSKPVVFVLTDGSGRSRQPRLSSTTTVLQIVGARPGSLYGLFTDAEAYETILKGDVKPLSQIARKLASALIDANVSYVVGDALEGFNPSHDLCRYLIDAAVALVEKQSRRVLGNFDFLLDGRADLCPEALRPAAIRIDLNETDMERKLIAVEGYPELRAEAQAALTRFGMQSFLTEYLRPVKLLEGIPQMEDDPPYYERYGEKQVAAGYYRQVIRDREHMRPLVKELWRELGLGREPWFLTARGSQS
jgi:hypothetical protein